MVGEARWWVEFLAGSRTGDAASGGGGGVIRLAEAAT